MGRDWIAFRPVRVDTPVGLCYNKAPFDRVSPSDGHFVHLDRLMESLGR
jgi:hypothetical protein